MTTFASDIEDVESFRLRAREWISENLPREASAEGEDGEEGMTFDDAAWIRARELQKLLYAGGFAGICYPKEVGGLGLTREHQAAFNEEVTGYETPAVLQTPTFTICGPTILDMANEKQRVERLSAAIKGDEVFVQFLSEPRGGSDLAGAITRATRDGDVFILNGSKIWSSGAYAADWALVPHPHRLGSTEAPRPDHVPAARPPAGYRDSPDQAGQRQQRVLPGVLRRRRDSARERRRRDQRRVDGRVATAVP